MNIETKHDIGNTVYFIKTVSIPTIYQCNMCLGEGIIYRKDNSGIECPKCHGNKTYSDSGSIKEVVKKGIIDHIEINIDNKCNLEHKIEIDICYYIENDDIESEYVKYDEIYEDKLYDTYEEAEKHIKKICAGYTS